MKKVQCMVAPYEADAQLAYLSRQRIVDLIITEDSDLLAFGARIVLYKYNLQTNEGLEISSDCYKNVRGQNMQS